MPRTPKRTHEQARRETEVAMLEAGAALLYEQPVNELLGQVKAAQVAARAGRTTGALFHLWPDLQQYRESLLDYVLSPERWARHQPATVDAISCAIDLRGGVELSDVTRAGAVANFDGLIADPMTRLQMAMWAKCTEPAVSQRLAILYRDSTERLTPIYKDLLTAMNRRMRPPYEIHDLAVALTALVEGLVLRRAVDPDSVPDNMPAPPGVGPPLEENERWNLFAQLSFTLAEGMTEPDSAQTPPIQQPSNCKRAGS